MAARAARTPGPGVWVLVAAIVGSSMVFIDGTAVNVALPVIGRELGATSGALQWVVEGYALSLSALIMIGGALGDRIGRRRVFLWGNALMAAASLGCALAPNAEILDAARFIQGIGGALSTPGSLALISATFTGQARGRAIGTWSGFSAMTSAIGPLLGGWLTQTAGWRWVFLINVPLALLVIAVCLLAVPESRDPGDDGPVDFAGSILAIAGLGGLTYGLIRMQSVPDQFGLAAALGGLVALGVFIAYERKAPSPMIPLGIFANRRFSGANLYTFALYAALGGSLFFLPFDLQNVQHYTPLESGAAMLPFVAIMFAFSRWSGGLVAHVGARLPLVAGAVVAAAGYLLFAMAGVDRSFWVSFFPAAVVLGIGGALFVAPLTTTVMESVGEHVGVASGINNAVARAAGLIAIAGFGLLFPSGAQPAAHSAQFVRDAYALGFRNVMFAAAALAIVAAAIALLTIDGPIGAKPSRAKRRDA